MEPSAGDAAKLALAAVPGVSASGLTMLATVAASISRCSSVLSCGRSVFTPSPNVVGKTR